MAWRSINSWSLPSDEHASQSGKFIPILPPFSRHKKVVTIMNAHFFLGTTDLYSRLADPKGQTKHWIHVYH